MNQTKQDELKAQVIAIARALLTEQEKNIKLVTPEKLEQIKEANNIINEFEKAKPAIHVMVEGGNIQGASATCDMDFELYDKDNYDAGDGDHDYRDGQTPDEWDAEIKKLTNEGELKGVY